MSKKTATELKPFVNVSVISISVCLIKLVGIRCNVFFILLQSPLPWSYCPIINNTLSAECERTSETAYFWYRTTLDAAPSIEDPGVPRWWIVICLLLAWITVFFIVMKGIQSSGKVQHARSL